MNYVFQYCGRSVKRNILSSTSLVTVELQKMGVGLKNWKWTNMPSYNKGALFYPNSISTGRHQEEKSLFKGEGSIKMKTNMFLHVMFYTFPQNNSTRLQINSLAIILPFLAKQAIQAYTAKWVTIPGIFYPSQVPKHHKGFTKSFLIQVWYPGEAVAFYFS